MNVHVDVAGIRTTLDQLATITLGRTEPLPDGDLAEHLDSLARLTLVVAIEDHWAIAFDAEDDDGVRTVDDVVRLVVAKLAVPDVPDVPGG